MLGAITNDDCAPRLRVRGRRSVSNSRCSNSIAPILERTQTTVVHCSVKIDLSLYRRETREPRPCTDRSRLPIGGRVKTGAEVRGINGAGEENAKP